MDRNDYISQGGIHNTLLYQLHLGDPDQPAATRAEEKAALERAKTGYQALCVYALRWTGDFNLNDSAECQKTLAGMDHELMGQRIADTPRGSQVSIVVDLDRQFTGTFLSGGMAAAEIVYRDGHRQRWGKPPEIGKPDHGPVSSDEKWVFAFALPNFILAFGEYLHFNGIGASRSKRTDRDSSSRLSPPAWGFFVFLVIVNWKEPTMTQSQLDREVARATGESLRTISSYSLLRERGNTPIDTAQREREDNVAAALAADW
jgi:hypothetical protein